MRNLTASDARKYMRKVNNYNTENQNDYKKNYLLLWCYPVRNYCRTGQRNGKQTGQQKNYRLANVE